MTSIQQTAGERVGWAREEMAQRAALDIPNGAYVNLGIGIPEKVVQYIPEGREVIYHTENGLLGMGVAPAEGHEDPELINAGKKLVTAIPGASYFHHADSFAMIRGGHIDICVLGAMQVAENGDLANWSTGAVRLMRFLLSVALWIWWLELKPSTSLPSTVPSRVNQNWWSLAVIR